MAIEGIKQKKYIVLDTRKEEYIMIGTYDEIQTEFDGHCYAFLNDGIELDIYELGELQEITLVQPAISFMSLTEKLQQIHNNRNKIN